MGGHGSKGLFSGTMGDVNSQVLSSSSYLKNTSNGKNGTPDSMRERLLNTAKTTQVKGIINELYRQGASTGDGGTADAIREQIKSGNLVGSKSHIQKGRERLKQIDKILAKNPNHPDRELLKRLRDDLIDALGGL